ncbi:MAG: presqualene diphosphate synthase HpnD [Rhodospirillales bacterium]|nr:presqualene diphosphate synthase HpnD [Rhodospirillales bacterium]
MTNPYVDLAGDPAVAVEYAVNNSGSSFLAAMRFLPSEKRRAMYALYSFCREVDDIADEVGAPEEKRRLLAEWRAEIDRLFAGLPERPISRVLADAVNRYDLPKVDLLALIDGMEMDAAASVRIADQAELTLYCDRVACSVGRLSNRIFGVAPEVGDALARALGEALQMTNILRDLREDAERDRLYMPLDLLSAHGISETGDTTGVLAHPRFPGACAALADLTRQRYAVARTLMAGCERRAVRPAAVMMEVYRAVFLRLEARGWRRLDKAVVVPRLLKLWIALRYGVF